MRSNHVTRHSLCVQVCDIYDLGKQPLERKNATVALSVDVNRFWDLMMAALQEAGKQSSLS